MHIINEIIKQRKEKIIFIQQCFRQFIRRRKLVSFAKKHKNNYSVYPSREDFNKISIKLYTNLKDPSKYVELPVHLCDKRNCYVFDIPKSKFPSKKKYMCFNFVIDDSTIVDSNYNCIYFGRKYVNQIDFNTIDKKELKMQKTFKSHMYLYKKIFFKDYNNKKVDINDGNEIQNSPLKKIDNINNINNLFLSNSNNKNNSDHKFLRTFTFKDSKSTFYSLNNSTEPFNIDNSFVNHNSKKKKKRNKSILKEHKNPKIKSSFSSKSLDFKKKVSFGWVEKSE